MNIANLKQTCLISAGASVLLMGLSVASASPQVVYGTYEQPLEGRRSETMRALAHYLDETAQDALAGVVQARRRGTAADRRYITSVRDFARQAERFHQRMDDYEVQSFDIPDEVDYLTARARRVNQQLRQARAFESTYGDWNSVIDVLNRMRRLLNGEEVEVPPAHDEYGDYNRDYGYLGGGGVGTRGNPRHDSGIPSHDTGIPSHDTGGSSLTGARLQQFRELAHQLDTNATQALQVAERSVSTTDRARGILADLRHFATQAGDVHRRSDANELATRDIQPIVNHLLEDARIADRSMRDARLFSDAWDEWARTIDTLNRMADLLR
jgi:hypothetical protein